MLRAASTTTWALRWQGGAFVESTDEMHRIKVFQPSRKSLTAFRIDCWSLCGPSLSRNVTNVRVKLFGPSFVLSLEWLSKTSFIGKDHRICWLFKILKLQTYNISDLSFFFSPLPFREASCGHYCTWVLKIYWRQTYKFWKWLCYSTISSVLFFAVFPSSLINGWKYTYSFNWAKI